MEKPLSTDSVTLVEASQVEEMRRPIFRLLLVMAAILLMILPFVTTFNEFLTRIVETAGLDRFLTDWLVPGEVRLVAVLLGFIGIPTQVTPSTILLDKGGYILPVFISWNCVGWQSFILYVATLLTGMQGPFTRISKAETMVVGFLGTFLVNLLRIASVAAVAFYFGQLPAVIYHDYGSTIIILIWLAAFWWFSHGWLLEPLESLEGEKIEERYLSEIHEGKSAGGRPGLRDRLLGWRRRRP
jgi:exosortase/archaeosortase family protein